MYLRFNHLNKEYALSVENFTATYLYPTAKINTYVETAKYFGDNKENIFTLLSPNQQTKTLNQSPKYLNDLHIAPKSFIKE